MRNVMDGIRRKGDLMAVDYHAFCQELTKLSRRHGVRIAIPDDDKLAWGFLSLVPCWPFNGAYEVDSFRDEFVFCWVED